MNKELPRPRSPLEAAACGGGVAGLGESVDLFRALGEPTRARLFGCLVMCGRGCTVGELAACCDVDLSVVSRHLGVLRDAGLADASKRGRSVEYVARAGALAVRLRELASAIDAWAPAGRRESGGCCG